jgi:hypothetical protein
MNIMILAFGIQLGFFFTPVHQPSWMSPGIQSPTRYIRIKANMGIFVSLLAW